jgi:cytochrome c
MHLLKETLSRPWPTLILLVAIACSPGPKEKRVLIFTKTKVFRHESIPKGIEAIKKLGAKYHFAVDTTENAAAFAEENLKKYTAVIFLSTTGDVLNAEQQNDFERYIQAGGGFVGIHAATDTEYDWPWYGKLVGAYFNGHPGNPNVQRGMFYVVDKKNMATDSLPDRWERDDEFYNFKNVSPDLHILIKIDEKTYHEGKMGDDHPMAWYHDFDGGRSFYTNMGHTNETFSDPLFLKHLWGGLLYAMGGEKPAALNYTLAHTLRMPEENRFAKIVLDEKLDEPMELTLLPHGRVLWVERKGAVKIYDPATQKTKTIATIAVSTKYKVKDGAQSEAEDGLLGVGRDPHFEQNHWIYLYYSPAGDIPKNTLVRYELKGDELVESSKKVLLEVGTQREQCCHTGGSIAFDAKGNLFLSTGDNTSPRSTAYSPADERPGRSPWDAQKSAGNTNDLRGKVLRIHPETDGSYTIPEGNLFAKGTPKTRPEIYIMGGRNPFRISVDKKTGFLYWGDVGPDAGKDSVGKGTKAFDEFNQARKPGYFGWPYFVGDNRAYNKWDFAKRKSGPLADAAKPVNYSPNNTGLHDLPPAQKAFIWYPYDASPEFPLVGTGGRTAMAGEVFYSDDFKNSSHPFPDYYNGKLFIYEWMRGWIMTVTMDQEGNYVAMERFMPSYQFSNPMDMEFSTEDGNLYLLEYGTAWFQGNDDARLVRIEYTAGNRKPHVQVAVDKKQGAVPLAVNFSSQGTKDFDHDVLTYEWTIRTQAGEVLKTLSEENPAFTFDKPGAYTSTLTVTDAKGEKSSAEVVVEAGNDPPALTFDVEGNKTFFFPDQPFRYKVNVTDKEDGSLDAGSISPDQVSVRIDYLKEGFDQVEIAQGHRAADASAGFATGKKIMEQSDCKSCHFIDKKSIGPMYKLVAEKYKDDPKAVDRLASKVINGGGGVWGETPMAAHPQLSQTDARDIVGYILSLAETSKKGPSLPPSGSYTPKIPKDSPGTGVLVLRAEYTDKGANSIPPISVENVKVLKSPSVNAYSATKTEAIMKFKLPSPPLDLMIAQGDKSFIGFTQLDLTGVTELKFTILAPEEQLHAGGGVIEVHLDSPTGEEIGVSGSITPQKGKFSKPMPQFPVASIKPTAGLHDLYFVCRNTKTPAGQPLFILLNIQFLADGITAHRK